MKVDQSAADAFVAVATADDGGELPVCVDEGAEVALRFTMEPEQMFGTLRLTAAQTRVTRGPAWEAIVTLDDDTTELPSNGVDATTATARSTKRRSPLRGSASSAPLR